MIKNTIEELVMPFLSEEPEEQNEVQHLLVSTETQPETKLKPFFERETVSRKIDFFLALNNLMSRSLPSLPSSPTREFWNETKFNCIVIFFSTAQIFDLARVNKETFNYVKKYFKPGNNFMITDEILAEVKSGDQIILKKKEKINNQLNIGKNSLCFIVVILILFLAFIDSRVANFVLGGTLFMCCCCCVNTRNPKIRIVVENVLHKQYEILSEQNLVRQMELWKTELKTIKPSEDSKSTHEVSIVFLS